MTNEEAIKVLDFERAMCRFNPMTGEDRPMDRECEQLADACDVAIEALEKQIPREPVQDQKTSYMFFLCPVCGDVVGSITAKAEVKVDSHCRGCGQSIETDTTKWVGITQ